MQRSDRGEAVTSSDRTPDRMQEPLIRNGMMRMRFETHRITEDTFRNAEKKTASQRISPTLWGRRSIHGTSQEVSCLRPTRRAEQEAPFSSRGVQSCTFALARR